MDLKAVQQLFPGEDGNKLQQIDLLKYIEKISTFRIYQDEVQWEKELNGDATSDQVRATNRLNSKLFEIVGTNREDVFFGDTIKQCLVNISDSSERMPIYTATIFSISPYTEVEHLDYRRDANERSIHELEGIRNEVIC